MSLRVIVAVAVALLLIAGTILLIQSEEPQIVPPVVATPEPIEVEAPQVALPAVTPEPVLPLPPVVTPEPELPVEAPQVVPPVVATPEPVEVPPLPEPEIKPVVIPDDFIVDNEHWKNAFILRKYDGTKYQRGGVMFVEIPTGTKLYAPVGGYVWVISVGREDREDAETTKLIIASHKEGELTPDRSYFYFMANHFDIFSNALTGERIEQGQEFASIKKSEELLAGFFDRKGINLAVGFMGNWKTDETIEDPREFIQTAIEKLN